MHPSDLFELAKQVLVSLFKSDYFLIVVGVLAAADLVVRLVTVFRKPERSIECNIIRLFEFPSDKYYLENEISLAYRGNQVQNVISFFILLRNNGREDIKASQFTKGISIELTPDLIVLSCDVFKADKGVNTSSTIDNGRIAIAFDLLKSTEKIAFRVFATQPSFKMHLDPKKFKCDYRLVGSKPNELKFGFPSDRPFWAFKPLIDPINFLFGFIISDMLFGNPMLTGKSEEWFTSLAVSSFIVFPVIVVGITYLVYFIKFKRKSSFYYDMEIEYRKYN
jgi:hypothetical protein